MNNSVTLRNGVVMPLIGLGTFQASGEPLSQIVQFAYTQGIRLIDTALGYKNGEFIFDGLKDVSGALTEAFITTKIGPRYHGRDEAHEGCETALEKLKMDTLDLMLVHWPGKTGLSMTHPTLPQLRKETWRVLEEFYKDDFRFRAIGVSNYELHHLEEVLSYAKVKPMVNQIEVHPRLPNVNLRKFCARHGIATIFSPPSNDIKVMAYCSLGQGDLIQHPVIKEIAQRIGKTPAQVLIKWALQHDMIVIPKSIQQGRVKEWIPKQMEGWMLREDDMKLIAAMKDNHRYAWDPSTTS